MRKEYEEEIQNLKIQMAEAEKFVKNLPIFEEQIIKNKYTGNEDFIDFGKKYKSVYLNWGIKRILYKSDSNRTITNYKGSYTKYLFSIYVNTYSLFNHHAIRVDEVAEQVPVFFYDKLNSTFYAEDGQIEALLDAIDVWYQKSIEENKQLLAEEKRQEAKKKLKDAEEELAQLNSK